MIDVAAQPDAFFGAASGWIAHEACKAFNPSVFAVASFDAVTGLINVSPER